MKKLMIVAAVAMAAVCSQAAQMKWSSSALTVPGKTTNLSASYGGTAMFYSIGASDYSASITAIEGMTADQASTYIYNQYSAKSATITSTTWGKGANTITDPGTYYTDGAPKDAYAVMIYTAYDNTDKKGDLYYKANVSMWHFDTDTGKTMNGMGTTLFGSETGTQAIAWQTVPEPTSGLLLLLGVAGLALKRTRA